MEGEDDGSYCAEEEEMEHLQACTTEDYESDDESDHEDDDADYPEEDRGSGGGGIGGELKQHALALLVAVVAAVAFHANMHGGFGAWRDEIVKDWSAMRSDYGAPKAVLDSRYGGAIDGAGTAPHAAPSMDAIPASKRRRALERALGKTGSASKPTAGGHARAKAYKRTSGLSFCPTNADALKVQDGNGSTGNLVEMEFILPLDPSVRVLHSYYLADALGTDSSMVYESVADLGSYDSDTILNEIDSLLDANDGEGLMLDQIEPIVRSHLPSSLPVDGEHVCLLHQYSLNKSSGRSVRGTTKVYKQPHVSTFYRSKFATGEVEPNYGMPPASLTFTGYAAKFINLSPQPLNLYWDGGRMSSGPRAGEMHTVLVGTVRPFESIGTSSFPGHSFYLAPTYDKDYQLKRWMITEDEPVLYYDPLEELPNRERREKLAKLTGKQRFQRDAWAVDRSFGRDYLIKTGRVWLANFPQPHSGADEGGMHIWSADYMGQTHVVERASLYFTSLPNALGRLAGDDYLPGAEERRRLEMKPFLSSNLKAKETENSDSTMQLNLKVRSVAPRVLEAKKFLSPVEVQHLFDLASGTKGDVQMKRSTVSASNVNSGGDKKRGAKVDARSSTGGWIHREQDVVVDAIFRRIADLLNIDESLMRDLPRDHSDVEGGDDEPLPTRDRIVEAMQLLRYGPGEEYSAHHDFTYPSIDNRYQPKRYATVLLYLTGEGDVIEDGIRRPASSKKNEDGLVGGETTFPRAVTADFHDGVKVEPQSGKAVVFYNTLPDGNMDDLSQHSGGKVLEGVKYVANVWVWDPIVN